MKCPVCNTWVMVKETRARPNNVAYRRYECANEHRFITLEKVERVIEKKEEPKKKSAWRKRQIEEQ